MSCVIDIQVACDNQSLPTEANFQNWLDIVSAQQDLVEQEITIRIVEKQESQDLNSQYRGKDKPTNVLSFPFEAPPGIDINLLGDLVICADIVELEAEQQNKHCLDHWAHLTIHGTLHLLGYDHENDDDANQMEQLEVALLNKLSIDDPYQDH